MLQLPEKAKQVVLVIGMTAKTNNKDPYNTDDKVFTAKRMTF